MMNQWEEYLSLAKKCAWRAGEIIKDAWNKETKLHFKAATDLVTETGQAEQLIISIIKASYPDHLIVAEENVSEGFSKEELTENMTWIIDPLDGTTNFVSRVPFVAVSIALSFKKKIVVGVIYNPIINEMFTACRGGGAFLNEKPIHTSKTDTLKSALIAIACGGEIPEEDSKNFLSMLGQVIQNCRSWRRCGSAALDMAYTAAGKIDVYCERGIHAWDISAGLVIVEESGGIVTDLMNKGTLDVCSRQVFASANVHLHNSFYEMIIKKSYNK